MIDTTKHMGEEPIGRLLVRYSLPAIGGFFAGALYQFVDRIMVGRGVGTDAVAAVTAAYPLSILTVALGLFIFTGTGNRMAVLMGKNDRAGAEQVLAQGMRLALFAGFGLAALTWLCTEPLLLVCGCEPRLLPMAVPFARIMSIGQIPLVIVMSMGNIFRVQGRPLLGFVMTSSGNVINAVLAAIAVFVLGWGVTGTALATATAQMLTMAVILVFVQSKHSMLHYRLKNLRANRALALSIVTLGAPFGLMQILVTVVFLAANHGAGRVVGTQGVAALGVLNVVMMLLLYPPLGVMQAMQTLIGYNKGAGNTARIRGLLLRVLSTTIFMGLVFTILVTIFPRFIAALFSRSDQVLIDMIAAGLPWFVLPMILFGATGTLAHYFLGVHEPKKAAVLLLTKQVLAIPLFLWLPSWLGFSGIYLVGPLADVPVLVIMPWIFFTELRRLNRRESRTPAPE